MDVQVILLLVVSGTTNVSSKNDDTTTPTPLGSLYVIMYSYVNKIAVAL
jgi:hypothetical protein